MMFIEWEKLSYCCIYVVEEILQTIFFSYIIGKLHKFITLVENNILYFNKFKYII